MIMSCNPNSVHAKHNIYTIYVIYIRYQIRRKMVKKNWCKFRKQNVHIVFSNLIYRTFSLYNSDNIYAK